MSTVIACAGNTLRLDSTCEWGDVTEVDPVESDVKDIEGVRFAEIVSYAQQVLGGREDRRASQRELSQRLGVAATMVGRYKSGLCDWQNLKASTIEALAAAAQLEVGTLFVWIKEGRQAAMVYQRQASAEPRAFEPVDLARELLRMLEGGGEPLAEGKEQPPETGGPRVYSEEEARQISEMHREAFRRAATDQLLSAREAWKQLKPLCEGMDAAQVTKFREVLSGWEEWSADEVNALSRSGALELPAQALARFGGLATQKLAL